MEKEKVVLFRYDNASQGGKILARGLGIKILKHEGSKFVGGTDKVIINWGSGRELPYPLNGTVVLNQPERVHNATHKLRFFELCREAGGIEIPPFTTRRIEAEDWLRNGDVVFGRTKLQGSGGDGIVELSTVDQLYELPEGTLFVKYVKKKHEFRVHVGDGKVIDRQQKKKRNNVELEEVNWRVRNNANGFVFARNEIDVPRVVEDQAVLAMQATGLDFGGVDVLYNERYKKAYVLEINTAPGLEGSTVVNYVNYFKRKLDLKEVKINDAYDVEEMARRVGIQIRR